jgi:hypothetical protein
MMVDNQENASKTCVDMHASLPISAAEAEISKGRK